jgi:hypothetical protein
MQTTPSSRAHPGGGRAGIAQKPSQATDGDRASKRPHMESPEAGDELERALHAATNQAATRPRRVEACSRSVAVASVRGCGSRVSDAGHAGAREGRRVGGGARGDGGRGGGGVRGDGGPGWVRIGAEQSSAVEMGGGVAIQINTDEIREEAFLDDRGT